MAMGDGNDGNGTLLYACMHVCMYVRMSVLACVNAINVTVGQCQESNVKWI